jgi:hypothetical protein
MRRRKLRLHEAIINSNIEFSVLQLKTHLACGENQMVATIPSIFQIGAALDERLERLSMN